jgi:hypothetical protein
VKPGIYPGVSMADYLSIEALSATPLRATLEECPQAGWFKSLMNPDKIKEESASMDRGSIAHEIVLEGSTSNVVVIDPAQYRSKPNKANPEGNIPRGWSNDAIKEARDAARAAGKHPILQDDFEDVQSMVAVASAYIESLRQHEPAIWNAFQPDGGLSEVTMVWDDDGTLCKLRADRIANDHTVCIDYKTTAGSAEPDAFSRSGLINMGYAFSAAWYRRGIKKLTGEDAEFVHLVQECDAPFLCSLVGMDPAFNSYASAKVVAALNIWKRCASDGRWPGYPSRVAYPELPPWESAKAETQLVGIPYDVAALFDRTDGK